ncbi:RNA polymerase II-associated protein 3-like isoform X2 [Dreissena polymorpha]|uniref:RNA polymerase II-associated protein 3-like isoform X1 n=1 Tax=Dreissena polymorpha TaxID=45954 RepID=UPI002264BF83|nr:RNA polymerase II-associated protein 3-like isoform X1 [Dreissena polymorpha]XP_052251227.1 RNA polymerase II-associated protein 3-like isoform X2 [Dreissena polymorpha]
MSKISPHEEKMLNLQYQMKQNNQELQSFLKDLESWESEIKDKEKSLKEKGKSQDEILPPVRNSLEKKKLKKKVKKKKGEAKPKRISAYDYRSWDKFDVDKACENLDENEPSSSEEEYETDEEWETERKKQAAVLEKDKGNEYFKKGDYSMAIECYTRGADLDPTNPLLPANRAMALLKQDKFAAAELDCSIALTLDPLYTKAYLRRGTARLGLNKYEEARRDYERVLQLEPQNKQAKSDIELIEKELAKQQMVSQSTADDSQARPSGIVKAITKPPGQRSQKPLRRIEIEEVGFEDAHEGKAASAKTLEGKSQKTRDLVEKETMDFQKFAVNSPADIANMASYRSDSKGASVQVKTETQSVVENKWDVSESPETVSSCTSNINNLAANTNIHAAEKTDGLVKDNRSLNDVSSTPDVSCVSKQSSSKSSSVPKSQIATSVPTTSVQFQADYRHLKRDKEQFYQYFKRIPPADYRTLFGQFLDADVLVTILNVLQGCYIRDRVDCYLCLKHLADVNRFSMIVMFMSGKDKQVLKTIFIHLREIGEHSATDIDTLAVKYEVR